MIRTFAKFSVVLILCAQLMACQATAADEQISVEALATQIEQGSAPLILDVRSAEEYAAGHIPGAININYKDIPDQLDTIRNFDNKEVVVYCERGVRAAVADRLLTEAGFTSVAQLTGSLSAWERASLPIILDDAAEE